MINICQKSIYIYQDSGNERHFSQLKGYGTEYVTLKTNLLISPPVAQYCALLICKVPIDAGKYLLNFSLYLNITLGQSLDFLSFEYSDSGYLNIRLMTSQILRASIDFDRSLLATVAVVSQLF